MVEFANSALDAVELAEVELAALVVRGKEGVEEADLASAELDTVAGVVLLWLAGAAAEELGVSVAVTGQMVV